MEGGYLGRVEAPLWMTHVTEEIVQDSPGHQAVLLLASGLERIQVQASNLWIVIQPVHKEIAVSLTNKSTFAH